MAEHDELSAAYPEAAGDLARFAREDAADG